MTTPATLHSELLLLCRQTLALLGFETPMRQAASIPIEESLDERLTPPISSLLPPLPSVRPPASMNSRGPAPLPKRQEAGSSLGTQVLPIPYHLPGEPFSLEPMGNPPPEAWSDLSELLHKAKWGERLSPPADQLARQMRDQWRKAAVCADLILVGTAGPSESLHQRLVQAIASHICPAIWFDASEPTVVPRAEALLLHPANRLLLISPEAMGVAPWLQAGIRQDPQGMTWKGRAAVLLDSVEELEQDPARKRSLWEGLQAWKRGG